MTKSRTLADAGTAFTSVSATELAFVDGVTSAIQTQIDGKQAVNANVSTTELGYLDGVTSPVQTQLDAKTAKATLTTTGDIYYASSASTPARLGIGSSAQVLTVAGGVPSWATAGGGVTAAVFQDKVTSGGGGTFTSGAWRTRDLQTSQFNNISGCSLASNQITLGAGTYLINAVAPANYVTQHQTRFQNITDSTTAIVGGNAYNADGSANADTYSALHGAFTIAGSKVFELQHQCLLTRAGAGFGQNHGTFGAEVYSIVTIIKIG